MKSRTKFFDRGIARNFLRRFWPLWTGYLVLILLLLPAALPNNLRYVTEGLRPVLDRTVLESGRSMVGLAFFVGVAVAMAMFHYLYQTRSCSLMHSLPLRRETLFFTAYLTGLLPLLLADLLAAGVTALLYMPGGYVTGWALLRWLALSALGKLVFYNFAVFCAMLTGNLIVLPAVYAVLNFTVLVAEACVRELLEDLVYGISSMRDYALLWLSPPAELLNRLRVRELTQMENGVMVPVPDAYRVEGVGVLAIYAAVSLLLLGVAFWLYRRRQMETATDVVAVPVLKPVFKYCLSFGTALVFATVVNSLVFQYQVSGWTLAGILLLLLLIGAFIGYFAAEMLIRKTLAVFRGHWRGYAVVAAVLTLLLVVTEADVVGFERRLPDPKEVQQVYLNGSVSLEEPENIAAVIELHRHFIEEKQRLEEENGGYELRLDYFLADGKVLQRRYTMLLDEELAGEIGQEWLALLNCPEAVQNRLQQRMDRYMRTNGASIVISGGTVYRLRMDDYNGVVWEPAAELSAAQAQALYEQGVLADARESRIGRVYFCDEPDARITSNLIISIELREENLKGDGVYAADIVNLNVEMGSTETLKYLREELGLEAVSQAEAGLGEYAHVADGGFLW